MAQDPITLMLKKCAVCREVRNLIEIINGICLTCIRKDWHPCAFCEGPTQRVRDLTLRCLDGHGHDVCPDCALEWENTCPVADEVRVVKELMA